MTEDSQPVADVNQNQEGNSAPLESQAQESAAQAVQEQPQPETGVQDAGKASDDKSGPVKMELRLDASEIQAIADRLSAELKAGVEGMAAKIEELDGKVANIEQLVGGLDIEAIKPLVEDARALADDLKSHNWGDMLGRLSSIEQKIRHFV